MSVSAAALERVRNVALGLPDVVEGTSYRTPAFKRGNKLFARMHQDGDSLVIAMDPLEREIALQVAPDVFFLTQHYVNYPLILVHLSVVPRAQLREIVAQAHAWVGAKKPRQPAKRPARRGR